MKFEFVFLEEIEPGKIYFIPNIVRCKKCDNIIVSNNGWKCNECGTQWSFSDYSKYFGMINYNEEPFQLRKLCDKCFRSSSIEQQIIHRIIFHDAEFNEKSRVIRYKDHLLDIIPPGISIKDDP